MRLIPPRSLSARLALLTAVLTVTALFALVAPAPSADAATNAAPTNPAPTIRLSVDQGPPGSPLLVSLSGFSPRERVNLYVGLRSVAAPVTGSDGSLTGYRILVPGVTPLGPVPIVANGSYSRFTAETSWTALSSPWAQPGGSAGQTQQNAGEYGLRSSTVSGLARTDSFEGPWVRTPPTVVDDVVYVATVSEAVTAYRPDGTVVWRRDTPVSANATVVAGGGRVYVGTSTGLQALSQTSGVPAWSTANTGEGAAFSYADGVLYLTRSTAGTAGLTALSASTGATLWTRPIPDAGDLVAPAVAEGRVLIRLADGGAAAFAIADGSPIWSTAFMATDPSQIAVSGSTVLAVSGSGLTALNAADGTVRWAGNQPVQGRVAVVGSRIVGALYAADGLYRATGLALSDGDELWQASRVNGSAAASAGLVFFAQYGDLSAIDPVDGDLVAKPRVNTEPAGEFVSVDGLGTPSVSGGAVWVPVATGDQFGRIESYGMQRFAVTGLDGVPAVRSLDDTVTGAGDDQISYTGGWVAGSRTGAYRDTFHYARSRGARATVTFTGVGVRIWYSQASNFGSPRVSIDGEYVDSLNEYISAGRRDGVKSWSSPLLTRGRHTVVIEAPNSTLVDVDRIDLGTS